MSKSEKTERKILLISLLSGGTFALAEFVMAIYSHSQSVLMDAAFDGIEIAIIGLTIFLTHMFNKPISEKRPFGYSQVESVFIVIKGFMMLSVTVGLSVNSIQLALSGGNEVNGTEISIFQIILGSLSALILIFIIKLNKKVSSPIIETEIYSWRLDVYYSLGMSAAFFLSTLLKNTAFKGILPYFDQIVAVLVVIFTLPEAIKMLIKAIKSMFLFAPEKETVENIKKISNEVLEKYNYIPTFFDITRTGRRLWVAIYFDTNEKAIKIESLKEATDLLNTSLSQEYNDCTAELIIQV